MPIGTFTNITQRHETSWVSAPPATRPIAPPAADTVVKRPMARTRWGPSEKMVVSSASEEGAARAAPTPCRARADRSIQPERASPPKSELDGEDGDAGQEGPAPAEEVAGACAQEQEAAEGEQVAVDDPGELAPREAEPLLDVRQGDVDDGGVQDDHQLGRQNDEQEHRRGPEQGLQAAGRAGGGSPASVGRGATVSEEGI